MESSLRRALELAGLEAGELDLVIPHQANQRIIDATRDRLGIGAEKVVVNIERYGNTSSASIPISLDEVVRAGKLAPGHLVGLVAFGGGATWGATVTRWTLPVQGRGSPDGRAAREAGASERREVVPRVAPE
jgi:3-oxoacyl-[acyl-carrier-protein] synthase-3